MPQNTPGTDPRSITPLAANPYTPFTNQIHRIRIASNVRSHEFATAIHAGLRSRIPFLTYLSPLNFWSTSCVSLPAIRDLV
jgi:hypothetical protein